jgi:uncharacterized protein (TIGR03663 family)
VRTWLPRLLASIRASPPSLLAAIVVGVLLRLVLLELRPIHHDEAVNWFFVDGIYGSGVYRYDPTNYHGPLYHYLAMVGRTIGWNQLWGLRLPTALIGAAMVPMAPALGLGSRRARIGAAWAVALSPALVFYARDAIHETVLAAACLGGLVALQRWFAEPHRDRWPVWTGVALGVGIATKETVVIGGLAMALGLLTAWIVDRPPLVRPTRRAVGLALGAMAAVVVVFYSGYGRDPMGLVKLAQTLQVWADRGMEGAGHGQPWTRFLEWMTASEAAWSVLAGLGILRAALRRDGVGLGLGVWLAVQTAIYSAITYKTPWCVIQLSLPAALLAGRELGWLWGGPERGGATRGVGRGAALILGAATLHAAIDQSFVRYDDDSAPLVYVQTHRELREAMQITLDFIEDEGAERVFHFHDVRYPINWFLRGPGLRRVDMPQGRIEADLLLAAPSQRSRLQRDAVGTWLVRRFIFRDGVRLDLWLQERFAHRLEDPEGWERVEGAPVQEPSSP